MTQKNPTHRQIAEKGYKARRGDLHIKYDDRMESYRLTTAPRPCRTSALPESQFTGMIAFYDRQDATVWINTTGVISMTWIPSDEVES